MKLQLITGLEHNIITSSEEIKEGDAVYEEISGIFSPFEEGDIVKNPKKIIAGLPDLPRIDYNGLEEKYDVVDIQRFIEPILKKKGEENNTIDLDAYALGLIDAFKTAQSLNDKKFSLQDMKHNLRTVVGLASQDDSFVLEDWIDSNLSQQPKVFDIEVERECGKDELCGCLSNDECLGPQPKITNDSIRILN